MMFIPREEGQGLVEYGLILILVAVAIVVALTLFGSELQELFSQVADVFL